MHGGGAWWGGITPPTTFLGPGCTWRCGFRDTTGVSGAFSGAGALRRRTCLFSDLPGQQDAQGPGPRPRAGAGLQHPQAGELRAPVSKHRREGSGQTRPLGEGVGPGLLCCLSCVTDRGSDYIIKEKRARCVSGAVTVERA